MSLCSEQKRNPQLKMWLKSVGQSVLVSGPHLGPATNFSFSLKFSVYSCEFVIL
jgi:hypothetical protein